MNEDEGSKPKDGASNTNEAINLDEALRAVNARNIAALQLLLEKIQFKNVSEINLYLLQYALDSRGIFIFQPNLAGLFDIDLDELLQSPDAIEKMTSKVFTFENTNYRVCCHEQHIFILEEKRTKKGTTFAPLVSLGSSKLLKRLMIGTASAIFGVITLAFGNQVYVVEKMGHLSRDIDREDGIVFDKTRAAKLQGIDPETIDNLRAKITQAKKNAFPCQDPYSFNRGQGAWETHVVGPQTHIACQEKELAELREIKAEIRQLILLR